jgi:serine/threonine protein kinase
MTSAGGTGSRSASVVSVPYVEDRYELGEPIGDGAIGTVYRARDRERDILVAVKIMRREHAGHRDLLYRFAEEASIATRMLSPHIVRVLGLAVTKDDRPCVVYEHLVGETLAARITRGKLEATQTADVVEQTARALTRAHQIGVLHRDVKPENIFLVTDAVTNDARPHVKLLDFGVAEVMDRPLGSASTTIVGTPEYIAPEILFGKSRPDARADLYALGVVAFECLTGRCPIVGQHIDDILLATARGERATFSSLRADLPDALGGALEAFFDRALHPDPFWRYPSARELAEAMRDAVALAGPRGAASPRRAA